MEQPLISIIIATYNAAEQLPAALESIFNQEYKNIELIIVDGGSTDATLHILKQYQHIIKYISEPDEGIYDALNKGVKFATGSWLYFMGADDRLLPGFSELAQRLKNPDTLYYGTVEADGPLFKGPFSNYRLVKYCINHQTIFYPKKVFKKYQYNLKYKVYADYALNLQCWGDKSIKKQYVDIPIVWYNLTGFSTTMKDEAFKRDKPDIIKKSFGWLIYLRYLYKRQKELRHKDSNFF